jgi:hypothetical protein
MASQIVDLKFQFSMNGLAIDIERDRASWHQWGDEGTILASGEAKSTGVFIGFDIELGSNCWPVCFHLGDPKHVPR